MSSAASAAHRPSASISGPISWGGLALFVLPIFFVALSFAHKFDIVHLDGAGRSFVLFAMLISVMLTGMPISIALGLTVLIFVFTTTTISLDAVALKLFTGIEKWEIMAIPFFILAGNFLTHGGIAKRMIDFAASLIGHFHGGLALAGVVSCAMFALVCGSSVATVVAIGSIILPEMVKAGYPMRFGAAVITVAGSLGILMLPSIPKVIYAISTNTSIGALFVAGVLPGTVLTFMLCCVTWYIARKNNYPRQTKATWAQSAKAFRASFWGLMLVVIIIGGIYSGAFTATEAAAMAAVYSFFIAVYVYKATRLRDVPTVLIRSANMSAMLLYIIGNASLFQWVLTNENIPDALSAWMIGLNLGPVGFLMVVNLMLLIAGNFMEPSSIILIMAPILAPTAAKLGIDMVHFGILIDVNMEVGLCHPPVGLNLYVASSIAGIGITELTKAVLPWLGVMLVFLVIVTYWPWLTLVVPQSLGMMNGHEPFIPTWLSALMK